MSVIPTPPTAAAPVEQSTTAPVVETPVAKQPEKDQFAEKLEMLSRKERSIWREKQAMAQEKKQLEAQMAEYNEWKASKEKAKHNPLDYLSKADLSYEKITEFMLNGGKPTEKDELAELREEFKRMREEQTNEKKQQQDELTKAQQAQHAQAIETFKGEIAEFMEQNKTIYELSAQRDATEDIFNTIQDAYTIKMQEWNKSGRIGRPPEPMQIKDAAEVVEEFYEKEVQRLTETAKWKARMAQAKEDPSKPKAPSPTLNNTMTSSAAASMIPAKNEDDRMRRALDKLG